MAKKNNKNVSISVKKLKEAKKHKDNLIKAGKAPSIEPATDAEPIPEIKPGFKEKKKKQKGN